VDDLPDDKPNNASAAGGRNGDKGRDGDIVVIKKYANRRLYNTSTSAYVTLEDLARMVREGVEFVVYDARTNEELTRQILTQIIFEEESRGEALLPVQFLRQLIGFYGNQMQGVLPGYLELSLENFARQQEQFRSQMTRAFGSGPGANLMEEAVKQNMAMFERALKMFPGFGYAAAENAQEAAVPPPPPPPSPAKAPSSEEALTEMRAQMEEMRAQIERLAHAKSGKG
jgi:polyhydroxyalkanoate synthesis repressor PhaR